MPASQAGLPVVVALGAVDPALVSDVLDRHCRFAATPDDAVLAIAAGAIVRADARVDEALLRRAPRLRVIARTGVGVDLVDVPAATARGIAVVITPGAGAAAVAEGAIGMALGERTPRRRPLPRAAAGAPSSTPMPCSGRLTTGGCPASALTCSIPSRLTAIRCLATPTSSSPRT